ncbi:DEKNAAC105113 [Brettanomyces naardenensis]|uniref:Aminopeptidase n=1 Tax=Brettanomyces naardenensis TaxID=13370 RepID=A0A448YSM3_BRENA|nr:DEKNAAC105113 [Brettanomyces naardenensis]
MAEHQSNSSPTAGRQVLPTNVKPLHYYLTLEPLFDRFKFNGDETIDVKVQEDSDYITLHTLEIDILDSTLTTGSGDIIKPIGITADLDDQTTTFKFSETLKKDDIVNLHIKFIGDLNDKMAGFYRSTYEENGEVKYLATTQMEPTDCRRAFPSFDEPNLKAKFSISLIGDKKFTFLSNMDVKEESPVGSSRKKVTFNTTPLMSTYLVAFIVGDLAYVESKYKFNNVPVRVYTTPGYESKGQYAAELAARALEYYEQSFGIKYPLPKMDMVGIHDFSAGAMENWGLITYRMVDLLYDEEKSTLDTRLRVSEVVAHELAHQWFGNYCTLDFWDSLWLNESFATYMSWKCCNHFYPDWKVWENFVGESLQYALTLDGLRSSHPIEVPVKRADEINQIFDAISYEKGSSILRMLANWLGEDVFITGVSNYLKKHSYSNAKTAALWESLSEVSGKDVQSTMKIWTEKVGYPLVSVNEAGSKVTLEQHRFLTTGDVKPADDKTVYPIFVGLKTDDGLNESLVFDKRTFEIPVDENKFFKVNGDSNGVYRVNYEPERWQKLGKVASKLSVEDRVGLVADAGALSVAGFSKTTNLLSLVSGWKSESSVFVWDEILSRLAAIKSAWLFEDETVKEAIKALTRDLVADKANKLGWSFGKEESFLDQKLKGLLFGSALNAGDKTVISAAKKMFTDYVAGDKAAIHPNLRASIFNNIASKGGEKEFKDLVSIYENPQSMDEKIAALRSLGRFEDPVILKRVLSLLLDGTVRSQDIYIPLQGMRSHKVGVELLFKWMCEKWETLYHMLPPGLAMLGSVVQLCTSGFTKEEQYEKVEEFFKGKDTKGFNQGLAQALETIQSKSGWVTRDSKDVEDWLEKNGYLHKHD